MSNKNLPAQLPEPQAGGRYLRNADGSLTLVEQTQEGRRRTHPDHVAAAERVAAGTGRAMTPAPQGAAVTGDGSGTALPPVAPSTKNAKE